MVENRLPTPSLIETDLTRLSSTQYAKLKIALRRTYNWTGFGTMNLASRILAQKWDHKIHEINYRSSRKINGSYALLSRPRHLYMIFLGDTGLDIPRSLYDIIVNLPENIFDHRATI